MAEFYIEMQVREIQIGGSAHEAQVVVLAEKGGGRLFPIFIGMAEAVLLDSVVRGERPARPRAHHLLAAAIAAMGGQVRRALITRLHGETFYGALEAETPAGEIARLDARPSDAIIVASIARAPLFVEAEVLRHAAAHVLSPLAPPKAKSPEGAGPATPTAFFGGQILAGESFAADLAELLRLDGEDSAAAIIETSGGPSGPGLQALPSGGGAAPDDDADDYAITPISFDASGPPEHSTSPEDYDDENDDADPVEDALSEEFPPAEPPDLHPEEHGPDDGGSAAADDAPGGPAAPQPPA